MMEDVVVGAYAQEYTFMPDELNYVVCPINIRIMLQKL